MTSTASNAASNASTSTTADRELVFTRLFNAPRELVYQAFTQPEHVVHWWGPRGFTNTILEMDVRPGGVWRLIMHGPDGTDYPNRIEFTEVVPPERLAWAHGDFERIHFHSTVTFEPEEGKTRLTMTLLFATAAERQQTADRYGAIEGNKQTMDRLEEYLPTM
jgi:uncharacterized protein YndB with AHSA1/START domain